MRSASPLSLQIHMRVLLLTCITLIPMIFFVLLLYRQQLHREKEIQIYRLTSLTTVVATEHAQIIEGARQLLISLSNAPELRASTATCSTYLHNLLSNYQRYGNFAVADTNGNVVCSAVDTSETINVSTRHFFKETRASKAFTVGEYIVSPSTNRSSLHFGYPIPNANSVVYATLDLSWLNQFISNLEIDHDTIVLILDQNGTILARNPEPEQWVGKSFPQDPLVQQLNSTRGIVEVSSIDQVKRLYTYEQIGTAEEGPYVVIGMPQSLIDQEPYQNLRNGLYLLLIFGLVSLSTGVIIGNALLSKIVIALKGVEKLKLDFVSLVSHQLRTPLTAIKWFTQILLSESPGKLTLKQKEILQDTLLSSKRIITLSGVLIDIAKLESQSIPMQLIHTDLLLLIRECLTEVARAHPTKKVQVQFRASHHLHKVIVSVDKRLIQQVIINLLDNAYKYTKSAGRIQIRVRQHKTNVRVEIQDNGIGIVTHEHQQLFSKFSRGTNATQIDSEGAGLGLYLVKLILQSHGGRIWFTSTVGKGTTFFFTIPIRADKLGTWQKHD